MATAFNVTDFSKSFLGEVIQEDGQAILLAAETNPPKLHTEAFSKILKLVIAFLAMKPAKQEIAINLLTAQPQLATTDVVKEMRRHMSADIKETSRRITAERLGEFLDSLAQYCKVVIKADSSDGKPTGQQLGAFTQLAQHL